MKNLISVAIGKTGCILSVYLFCFCNTFGQISASITSSGGGCNSTVNFTSTVTDAFVTTTETPCGFGSTVICGSHDSTYICGYEASSSSSSSSFFSFLFGSGGSSSTPIYCTVSVNDYYDIGTAPCYIGAFTWNFGDGGTSTVASPAHTYSVPGIYTVALTVSDGGCLDSKTVTTSITIDSVPSITGLNNVCVASTITLNSSVFGGTWNSSNTSIATVNSSSGMVTGVSAGTVAITNTTPAGCQSREVITVNPLASLSAITYLCVGLSTNASTTISGGYWSSSNTSIVTAGSTGIITGINLGSAVISYSLPTGCTSLIGFNVYSSAPPILVPTAICVGQSTTLSDLIVGGTWVSSAPTIATIGSSTGLLTGIAGNLTSNITYTLLSTCKSYTTVSVNVLSAIGGPSSVCAGESVTLTDATIGGTWSCNNTAVATIGSLTGVMSGIIAGTAIISYKLPSGCIATETILVNPLSGISALTGTSSVCVGQTTGLFDSTSGGVWSSPSPTIATIGSSSGIVTGIAGGLTANISYSLSTGCRATKIVTVYPLSVISGPVSVCQGQSITLTNATLGGTWSTGISTIAAFGTASSGILSGIDAGSTTISYILPTGCTSTATVLVKALGPIIVPGTVCPGRTITLTDGVSGGTWSSASPTVASIIASTGVLTGVAANTHTTISYTLSNGCMATAVVSVNPVPTLPAAIGGPSNVSISGVPITLSDITPGGTWISSNAARASVGSLTGVVTGISIGTLTLTYSITNANGCSSIATKNITVGETPPPHINLNYNITTLTEGDSLQLNEAIPGGIWSCNYCDGILTLDSSTGKVAGINPGFVTITYTINEDTGTSINYFTVTVRPLIGTSISQLKTQNSGEIVLVPNPNKGSFTIKGNVIVTKENLVTIEIVDMKGQVVYKRTANAPGGKLNESIQLDISISNGIYLLNLLSGSERERFHFILDK